MNGFPDSFFSYQFVKEAKLKTSKIFLFLLRTRTYIQSELEAFFIIFTYILNSLCFLFIERLDVILNRKEKKDIFLLTKFSVSALSLLHFEWLSALFHVFNFHFASVEHVTCFKDVSKTGGEMKETFLKNLSVRY